MKNLNEEIFIVEVGNSFIHTCFTNGNEIINPKNYKHSEIGNIPFKDISGKRLLISSLLKYIKEEIINAIKTYEIIPYEITIENQGIIKNTYTTLGVDRICDLVCAKEIYPNDTVCIFNFGTATTISSCDENNNFLGGLIKSGLETEIKSIPNNIKSLADFKISLNNLKEINILCKSSEDAILNGVIFDQISTIKNYIESFKNKINKQPKIIFTGGNCELISKYFKEYDLLDKYLGAKGIYHSYKKQCLIKK